MPKGYVIVRAEVTNPATWAEYVTKSKVALEEIRRQADRAAAARRRSWKATGCRATSCIEFDSFEKARGYATSPEYAEAKKLRQGAGTLRHGRRRGDLASNRSDPLSSLDAVRVICRPHAAALHPDPLPRAGRGSSLGARMLTSPRAAAADLAGNSADALPELFPGPLGVSLVGEALEAGLWSLARSPSASSGSAGIGRSTTRRPAAAPAWSCAPTCSPPPSTTRVRANPHAPLHLPVAARRAPHPDARARARGRPRRAAAGRPLRGHRRARHRGAPHARGLDRRLRAVGRRAGGHGADRRLRSAAAGRGRRRRLAHRGELRRQACSSTPTTREPREWEGRTIPDVLLSGDHKRIAAWRRARPSASPPSAGPTF